MTHVFDATGLISLIWPLVLCAAAWGVVVWALRQRDPVSEAVNGLLSPRPSASAGAAVSQTVAGTRMAELKAEGTTLSATLDAPLPKGRKFARQGPVW